MLFKTIFRLALPAAFFNKPDNMQDRRPRFLQLISFSNLSMPGNLVMTSPYSVYPYRLWGRVKKTSVGWGREFQTYVCCISFLRKKKKNKTKTKQNKKQKKKKHLEANLLCSPQSKIFGNKFLRPQLTLLSRGFGYTPGTTQSPSPLAATWQFKTIKL